MSCMRQRGEQSRLIHSIFPALLTGLACAGKRLGSKRWNLTMLLISLMDGCVDEIALSPIGLLA